MPLYTYSQSSVTPERARDTPALLVVNSFLKKRRSIPWIPMPRHYYTNRRVIACVNVVARNSQLFSLANMHLYGHTMLKKTLCHTLSHVNAILLHGRKAKYLFPPHLKRKKSPDTGDSNNAAAPSLLH